MIPPSEQQTRADGERSAIMSLFELYRILFHSFGAMHAREGLTGQYTADNPSCDMLNSGRMSGTHETHEKHHHKKMLRESTAVSLLIKEVNNWCELTLIR